MTITIQANSAGDAMQQLALQRKQYDIAIDWVKTDYGHTHERGAIVTVSNSELYRVPIHCKTGREVIAMVAKVVKHHENYVTRCMAEKKKQKSAPEKK